MNRLITITQTGSALAPFLRLFPPHTHTLPPSSPQAAVVIFITMEWPRFTGWIALLLTAMAWLAGANDDYLVTFPNVPSAGTILKDGYMLGHFHSDELTLGDITISSSLPPKHPGQLYFNDNMYFGDDRAYGYPQANDQNSIFLCRVDDNGDPIWGEAFTAEGGFNTRDEEGAKLSPKDLAVDENGNAYVLVRVCVHV